MRSFAFFSLIIVCANAQAQEFTRDVQSFNKVVTSPKIDLVLKEGNEESVTIKYEGVDPKKIRVKVSGKKLCIYLENARYIQKNEWVDNEDFYGETEMYKNAVVTAYVTYKSLTALKVRGDQQVSCESEIKSDRFKLQAYGENELQIFSLEARRFRASLYGDNSLRIRIGQTGHQKYSLYGDNRIEARGVVSQTVTSTIYGDGLLSINTTEELRLNSFGDPDIILRGSPVVSRGLIFGGVSITRR